MFENKLGIEGFLLNLFTANKIKINSILEIGTEKNNTIRKVIDYFNNGLFLVDDIEKFEGLKDFYKDKKNVNFKPFNTKTKKSFDLIHINYNKASDFNYKDYKFKYLVLSNIPEDFKEVKLKDKEVFLLSHIKFNKKECLIVTT